MILMIVYAVISRDWQRAGAHPVLRGGQLTRWRLISAVLKFRRLWGILGDILRETLATLFKAVLYAWPRGVEAAHEEPPEDHPGVSDPRLDQLIESCQLVALRPTWPL